MPLRKFVPCAPGPRAARTQHVALVLVLGKRITGGLALAVVHNLQLLHGAVRLALLAQRALSGLEALPRIIRAAAQHTRQTRRPIKMVLNAFLVASGLECGSPAKM